MEMRKNQGGDELGSIKKKKALNVKYYDDQDTIKIADTKPLKKKYLEELRIKQKKLLLAKFCGGSNY